MGPGVPVLAETAAWAALPPQEAQDHRCDQLGGGEGTESVEQYLATLVYSTCLFSLRA